MAEGDDENDNECHGPHQAGNVAGGLDKVGAKCVFVFGLGFVGTVREMGVDLLL